VRGNLKNNAGHLGKALLHDQGRKFIPLCLWRILQSNCAINTPVYKQDMEFVTGEFEKFRRFIYRPPGVWQANSH
jgi:hypothetical protein